MRIRRGLSSRQLPCGCVAGVYETYDEQVVMIVDARDPACTDAAHADGNVIPAADNLRHPPVSHDPSRA